MDVLAFVIIAGVIVVIGGPIAMYNGLVRRKNQVENAFGSLDAMLKQRYDLIPNLVSSVQQYMKHESETLTSLTELRTRAVSGTLSDTERAEVDGQMGRALSGVMVAVENYPDLKANTNFLQLQGSLNEVEEKIGAARRNYNRVVTDYNNGLEQFPSSIMASMMGYQRKAVFEATEAERASVDVKALFNG